MARIELNSLATALDEIDQARRYLGALLNLAGGDAGSVDAAGLRLLLDPIAYRLESAIEHLQDAGMEVIDV